MGFDTAARTRGPVISLDAEPRECVAVPTLSRDAVTRLARLARIGLSDDETNQFTTQFDVILAAVDRVGEVTADDVAPTTHAVPMVNVFRDDVVGDSLTQAEALSGAPAAEDGRFRVPRILDEA
jgi:aspartyl-tRNA(Asn)/glutamyl-tRNA(Gln) amidotransferase subunit C